MGPPSARPRASLSTATSPVPGHQVTAYDELAAIVDVGYRAHALGETRGGGVVERETIDVNLRSRSRPARRRMRRRTRFDHRCPLRRSAD